MTSRRPHALPLAAALAAVALLAALLGACTGDEPDTASTTPGTTAAEPEPDILVTSPASLHSYRYEVTVEAIFEALSAEAPEALAGQAVTLTVQGERINPDQERTISSGGIGPITFEAEIVRIGSQQWVREGTRPWTESAAGGMDVLVGVDFRPAALFVDDPDEYAALSRRLADYTSTRETLDGIVTRHFTFTEDEFFEVFQGQGDIVPPDVEAELAADIWLSEELGAPVRLLVTGSASDGTEVLRLQLDIRDLNDETIEISPPI